MQGYIWVHLMASMDYLCSIGGCCAFQHLYFNEEKFSLAICKAGSHQDEKLEIQQQHSLELNSAVLRMIGPISQDSHVEHSTVPNWEEVFIVPAESCTYFVDETTNGMHPNHTQNRIAIHVESERLCKDSVFIHHQDVEATMSQNQQKKF